MSVCCELEQDTALTGWVHPPLTLWNEAWVAGLTSQGPACALCFSTARPPPLIHEAVRSSHCRVIDASSSAAAPLCFVALVGLSLRQREVMRRCLSRLASRKMHSAFTTWRQVRLWWWWWW